MRYLLWQAIFLSAIFMGMMNTGCSLLQTPEPETNILVTDNLVKFSDNQNVLNTTNRNYKRMTRQKMEEEAELHAQAGSMWVMEGQGAYLFAQNKTRREGDLLNVRVEGGAMKQVDTKVGVIKKLLKQLEDEEQKAKQKTDDESQTPMTPVAGDAKAGERAPASAKAAAGDAAEKAASEKVDEKAGADGPVLAEAVPTRIVERLPDGNYRVKGQAPFMIGKREYKVIVTGMIRPEDYNDEGVSSNKLLDAQFDVVSLRKKEALR